MTDEKPIWKDSEFDSWTKWCFFMGFMLGMMAGMLVAWCLIWRTL